MNRAADIATVPTINSAESTEDPVASDQEGCGPSAGEENIMKTEFDFQTRTVELNSGYEMPVNGPGTCSLHGEGSEMDNPHASV